VNEARGDRSTLVRRLAAYGLDCLLLFAGLLVLQAVLYPINPIVSMRQRGASFSGTQLHLWVFATATMPFLLYFAAMISSSRQATLGMRWLKLRVGDVTGRRVSFARAILRTAVLLLPFELNHTMMFHAAPPPGETPGVLFWAGISTVWVLIAIYLTAAAGSRWGQSIHDRVAGTRVLRDPD
jgi:uncharacterized RDD family membrane protein YckC